MTKFALFLSLLSVLFVAGCGVGPNGPPRGTEIEIAELTRAIRSLGPDVDPEEAARAARISYEYTHVLALEYEITDPPLIHNSKVNMGLRPRGLCWHWAEDMENRLAQEDFATLSLHRAIANADNQFRIDHSTVIVSARGDTMFDGIVLDPWRKGGILFWAPFAEDTRYNWQPQAEVLERKRQEILRERAAEG